MARKLGSVCLRGFIGVSLVGACAHAFWVVAGWSFFPFVPTDLVCDVAGLVQMPYRRMISALILGEVPLVVACLFLSQRVSSLPG